MPSVQSPQSADSGFPLSDQSDFYGPIDTGFSVFCRESVSTKPIDLLGAEVIDVVENGLDRSKLRSPFGSREQLATGILAVAFTLALVVPSGFVWALFPVLLAGLGLWLLQPWLNSVFVWRDARREASGEELQAVAADDRQRAFVRALQEYRRLLTDDPTRLSCETRNAGETQLSESEVRALRADHGRQLLMSSDRTGWSLVKPPLPRGRLMVSLRGARAKSLLSSKLLMLEGDEALFESRLQWIIRQAHTIEKGSKALINGLSHIRYLREQRLAGLALKDVVDQLDTERGLKSEMAQKLWSGNHADFEKALKKLPLESMP